MAQDSEEPIVLDTLQVEERTIDTNPYAEPGAPYKARVSGDSRHVKPLAETPQTINVFTQTQIKESGREDLREILQAQPGITLGTGENGNAFGDRYVIRGHEARSDVFVDGLRDPGMTIRESFATEQVEVSKGPSSTFAGRGSTGGAINSVTKQASTEYDFSKVEAGVGTDNYGRITVDSNTRVNDQLALRANLLYGTQDVPDRDPADKERTGVALSGSYDVSEKLSLVADYYYLKAEDKPDLGTYIRPNGGKPVDDLPVYLQAEDFLESEVNTGTFSQGYSFNERVRLENSMRYGTTENGYVATGARGTQRAASDPLAPGADTVGLSTHQGWQDVEYFVDQANLYIDLETGAVEHQLLFGAEYSDLNVKNGVYNVDNTNPTNCIVSGRGGDSPSYCMIDPGGALVDNVHHLMGRDMARGNQDSDFNVETLSLSIMDTITFNEDWSLFLGLRYDDFDYQNTLTGRDGDNTDFSYSDGLWNGHAGLVYNFTDYANVYLTYSTSSNINGGESDVGGSCGYGGLCGDPVQVTESEPEQTESIELGTKWSLVDDKLLFSAAFFRITKDDVMENVGDDYATLGTLNTGRNRVKGLEISLVGNITDRLSTQLGLAIMDSEVLDAFNPDHVGLELANFANDSLFWQTRYQLTSKLALGGTFTYSSEMYAGQPDAAAGYNDEIGDYSYTVPSYTVFDVFATYEVSEKLNVRLNVANVTDEDYYLAAYRSGAFAYIGDARNAQVTVSYEF